MICVLEDKLPVDEIISAAEASHNGGSGAVVTFIGTVRNKSLGQAIQYLEYQAYKPMAEREMRRVAAEVEQRWGLSCAMAHRVGRLEIGEASIVIAVASPHRKAAFEACHYAIDRVKEIVPVWKKEVAIDGSWWVEDPLGAAPVATKL